MELNELSLKTVESCEDPPPSVLVSQQVPGSEVSGLKPLTEKHHQIGLDFCERLLGMTQEEQREECSGV